MMVLRGEIMVRHHIGLHRMHPDRRSCLTLSANDSVGWQTKRFFAGWANKVPPSKLSISKFLHSIWHMKKFLSIFDRFLSLDNSCGKTSVAHPLVNPLKLPYQSPQLGNTAKYTPRGPMLWKENSKTAYSRFMFLPFFSLQTLIF